MKHSELYWENRFGEQDIPEKVKNAIKRVYDAYPDDCMPQGLSDPMYIINCIALEIGFGDGQGNFNLELQDINTTQRKIFPSRPTPDKWQGMD